MQYSVGKNERVNQMPIQSNHKILSKLNQVSQALRSFSLKLMKNEFDANDLYQDTVLSVITKYEKFNPESNFKAWAMTIMRNIFINNYRRKKRMKAILNKTQNGSILSYNAGLFGNEGESKIAYKELLRMLSTLPENFKLPFWMAFRGYKYKEIAEMLNVPIGTIKCRIFFARQSLQCMYKEAERA